MEKLCRLWVNRPTRSEITHFVEFRQDGTYHFVDGHGQTTTTDKTGRWKIIENDEDKYRVELSCGDSTTSIGLTMSQGTYVQPKNQYEMFDSTYGWRIVFDTDPFAGNELDVTRIFDTDGDWNEFFAEKIPQPDKIFQLSECYCFKCHVWLETKDIIREEKHVHGNGRLDYTTISKYCKKCRSKVLTHRYSKFCLWCSKCERPPSYMIEETEDHYYTEESDVMIPHGGDSDSSTDDDTDDERENVVCVDCSRKIEIRNLSGQLLTGSYKCRCESLPYLHYRMLSSGIYILECRVCQTLLEN